MPAVQWPKCTSPNGNKYVQAQMATNMYKPKWQQVCTSPNGNKYVQAQIAIQAQMAKQQTTIIICQPYKGPNGNQKLTHTP